MSIARPPLEAPTGNPGQPAPAAASAQGHTLTVQLRAVAGGMAGRLVVKPTPVPADALRVRVPPSPHAPWTYTA